MKCLLCERQLVSRFCWRQLFTLSRGEEEEYICQNCRVKFVQYPAPRCPGCGRTSERLCQECRQWEMQLGWHLAHRCLYQYNEAMKAFMHRYKFQGDYRLRYVFAAIMTRKIQQMGADLITVIPISQESWATRGFNQVSGLINEETADLLRVSARHKRAQSSRNRQERLKIDQPFAWNDSTGPAQVRGKDVLLVDDVYTTGRTMYYGADLIRQAGAKSVKTLSLAG